MSWFKATTRRIAGHVAGHVAGHAAGHAAGAAAGLGAHAGEGGSTIVRGHRAEDRARRFLEARGLTLLATHYRVARGPSRPAGEVDLVMRDADAATVVFVEVRSRRDASFGGAAASVDATKQRRIVRAAQHYLRQLSALPPCRFDVVAIDGDHIEWIPAAFDAT